MSEGDSVGESIHGKPSVVAVFFTRIGQVKCLYHLFVNFISEKCVCSLSKSVLWPLSSKYYANVFCDRRVFHMFYRNFQCLNACLSSMVSRAFVNVYL